MTNGMNKIPIFKAEDEMSMDNANFYSEDDIPEEVHSPTDSSEDSVEVKVSPISGRNKRKCAEPRKVHDPIFSGPLKKRMCLQARAESEQLKQQKQQEQQQHEQHQQQQHQQKPFRPWSKELTKVQEKQTIVKPIDKLNSVPINYSVPYQSSNNNNNNSHVFACPQTNFIATPSHGFFRPPSPIKPSRDSVSPQPVSLVIKREINDNNNKDTSEILRVPTHPQPNVSNYERDDTIKKSTETFPKLQQTQQQQQQKNEQQQQHQAEEQHQPQQNNHHQRKEQRNYKNMTRERRIEANARERTRVHTISAAFDTLRRAIPAYSHSQKLSKLSVLRIACSYIMTLSDLVQDNTPSIREGVEAVSRTIQREGKLRKKKDDE